MNRSTKIWVIIAVILVLIGFLIFRGVMSHLNWDFTKLSTADYVTNSYEITEEYKNISIISDTADIEFAVSDIPESSVKCYEQANVKHDVTVKNNTLVIEVKDTRKWYEHIGLFFDNTKISLYIPQGEYAELSIKSDTGDVEIPKMFKFNSIDISDSTGNITNFASAKELIQIKTSTGDICVEKIATDTLSLTTSTGNITVADSAISQDITIKVSTGDSLIKNVDCKAINSNGSTGDITLKNALVKEKVSVSRSTGDISLEKCDANELFIETDTGDVKGSLLSEKIFITKTDTGFIDVPKTTNGGKCEINTDTGNIKMTVLP